MSEPQSLAEVGVRGLNEPLARAQAEERLPAADSAATSAQRGDDVLRQDKNGRVPHLP